MNPRRIWLRAAALLALIWSVVAVIMSQTDDLVSWPEKVIAMAQDAPWLHGRAISPEARRLYVHQVITHMNRLDAKQRRTVREDGQEMMDAFFATLTEDEQKEYVNRTVEPYLDQLDAALKRMPADERKRIATRMRTDLKSLRKQSPQGDRLSEQDQEFMDLMISEDPVLFLRDAPVKTKMELAPVLEDMQSRVQGMR